MKKRCQLSQNFAFQATKMKNLTKNCIHKNNNLLNPLFLLPKLFTIVLRLIENLLPYSQIYLPTLKNLKSSWQITANDNPKLGLFTSQKALLKTFMLDRYWVLVEIAHNFSGISNSTNRTTHNSNIQGIFLCLSNPKYHLKLTRIERTIKGPQK